MGSPSEIVTAFIAQWEEPEGFPEAVENWFTDETVWENVGLITTSGRQEAVGFYDQFSAQTGMTGMKIDVLAIAESGNKVLTERVDYLLGPDGKPVMTVPVMGVFEVAGDRITAWRDYFDTIVNVP
jgi:limonene-1,2-epoxide hydrolase